MFSKIRNWFRNKSKLIADLDYAIQVMGQQQNVNNGLNDSVGELYKKLIELKESSALTIGCLVMTYGGEIVVSQDTMNMMRESVFKVQYLTEGDKGDIKVKANIVPAEEQENKANAE